jgi:uncharacterized glyoxalase superfamily protein PhnB
MPSASEQPTYHTITPYLVVPGVAALIAFARPASLYLRADDVDAVYARALEAGATSLRAPEEQPYGRSAGVRDASGNVWWIIAPGRAG